MAHLFDHHTGQRLAVPIRGRSLEQIALLLDACEFGIALVDDQVHQRVTHVLRGNLAQVFPFGTTFVIAERDFLGLNRAVESLKPEILDVVIVDADFRAPFLEQPNPIAERPDLHYFSRHYPSSWLLASS